MPLTYVLPLERPVNEIAGATGAVVSTLTVVVTEVALPTRSVAVSVNR